MSYEYSYLYKGTVFNESWRPFFIGGGLNRIYLNFN